MINQEKSLLKRILPHVGAILCFLFITLIYFSPVLIDGKVLPQADRHQFEGMSHELMKYYHDEGESSAWTGSMFSGMPAYQIGIWGSEHNMVSYIEAPLKLLGHTSAGPMFAGMIMAYILFVAMGFGVIPSILGAIAYSFSSYNIIIIEAGHVTKAWAIAYMPLVIAGFLVIFQKKYIFGGLLMALGLCLQVKSNHLQITYYTGLLCLILYIGYVINSIIKKEIKDLLKASVILAIAVIVAVLCNLPGFYSNYEMAQESTRGKSELSQPTTSEKQSSGLDKDYAFAWSYGKSETLSLLIPNIHGGKSGGLLGPESNVYKQLKANGAQVPANGVQMYTYWGDQPFTSGPVYFGAIICFLFVLGMIIIKNNLKWVLFIATIFFIFLSWGKNFETFNDLFFYHFPLYSKFRAVSTALVIPALTMIIIAVWGLKEFFTETISTHKKLKVLYISGGITAGLCLFFWLLPDFFFNFTSEADNQWKSQYPDWFYNALLQDRKDLFTADALRSFLFIVFATAILWVSVKIKSKDYNLVTWICAGGITVLVIADLWNIDRRYLNSDMFERKSTYQQSKFPKTKADEIILQDQGISYRVLNLNNPFNESNTSYYHKSIGGYHAAKLKRYQELIDYRLQNEINEIISSFQSQNIDTIISSFKGLNALNMLNAKYIIFDAGQPPIENPYRLGNAWFVSDFHFVNNADEEIKEINNINPGQTAVIDKKFENLLSGFSIIPDSTASIVMTSYKPNKVSYKTSVKDEQLAVFSEIYYANGWQAFIDGKPVPHLRANWTLRALRIPAGEHEVEFKFIPTQYNATQTISTIFSSILVILFLGSIVIFFRKMNKKES